MLPRWVFGLLSLRESAAGRSEKLSSWCERALCQYVAPSDRGEVTIAIYQKQTMYQAGQPFFSRGIFEWEKRLFTHDAFPKAGNVLIPAAGGGREALWFIERGYNVTGFDPTPSLVSSWNRAHPQHPMIEASYQDLLRMLDEGSEASLVARDYSAIVLGWGSLSHLLEESERLRLMSGLRARYPRAVVALSFLSSCDREAAKVPGREPIYFLPWGGFVCLLGRISLQKLATASGYRIVFYSDEVYSHALLYPTQTGV